MSTCSSMAHLACSVLANHALRDLPRLQCIIEAQAANVRVGADALDPRQVLDLGLNSDVGHLEGGPRISTSRALLCRFDRQLAEMRGLSNCGTEAETGRGLWPRDVSMDLTCVYRKKVSQVDCDCDSSATPKWTRPTEASTSTRYPEPFESRRGAGQRHPSPMCAGVSHQDLGRRQVQRVQVAAGKRMPGGPSSVHGMGIADPAACHAQDNCNVFVNNIQQLNAVVEKYISSIDLQVRQACDLHAACMRLACGLYGRPRLAWEAAACMGGRSSHRLAWEAAACMGGCSSHVANEREAEACVRPYWTCI